MTDWTMFKPKKTEDFQAEVGKVLKREEVKSMTLMTPVDTRSMG